MSPSKTPGSVKILLASVLKVSEKETEDAVIGTEMAKIVERTDKETLLSAISSSLLEPHREWPSRTAFLRLVLLGCRHLQPTRVRILECGLQHLMRGEDVLDQQVATDVVQIMREELTMHASSFSTDDLQRFIQLCHDEIRDNQAKFSPRWLEFLSDLLTSIHGRDLVTVENDDGMEEVLAGREYRTRYIELLCRTPWNPSNATSLCQMLKVVADEAVLTPVEYGLVMEKLCSSLERLDPQEVPPLVYQMLRLSKNCSSISIIYCLTKYYGARLKKSDAIESEDMIDSESDQVRASMQSECTVVFHICNAVRMDHQIAKDLVKIIKSGAHAPELILDQFILFLSLSLASVKAHHQTIMDSLKSGLVKSIAISLRRSQDAWFREATKKMPSGIAILERLVEQASLFGSWNLIGQGVLTLATVLLDASPGLGKPDRKLKQTWQMGIDLLLRIPRHSSHSIRSVVEVLTSRIISSQAAPQYTECLRLLVKGSFSLFMENPTLLNDLVDQVCSLNMSGAKRILQSMLPIIKINRSLRDSTILALRKALFACSHETKQIGIIGVLQLLQIFKISSSLLVTQMSQTSSGLSQIEGDMSKGIATPNEVLCNELMGVLRRGLTQSAQVRLKIYHGLYNVVARNPELCCSTLDLLQEHGIRQEWIKPGWNRDHDEGTAVINLDKLFSEVEGKSLLVEPVGWYIHCMQQLITRSDLIYPSDDDEDEDAAASESSSRVKLTNQLNKWAKKYSVADLLDLGFTKDADFSPNSPDGEVNIAKVETTKNIYEALMEFTITHGVGVFEETAKLLLNLYKRHVEVAGLLKSTGGLKVAGGGGAGAGKKRDKKKADKNDDAANADKKKGKSVPSKSKTFRTPETAFTFRGLSVILRAVLIDTTPATQQSLAVLRKDTGFIPAMLKMLREKQTQLDKYLSVFAAGDDLNNDLILKHMSAIAGDLVQYCLGGDPTVNADEFGGENLALQLAVTEALLQNMEIATTYFPKREDYYIKQITPERNCERVQIAYAALADKIMTKIGLMQDSLREQEEEDVSKELQDKVFGSLYRLLMFVVRQVGFLDAEDTKTIKKIYDWSKSHGESDIGTSVEILKPFLELLCESCRSANANSTLLLELSRELHSKLGNLDNSIQTKEVGKYDFVSKDTGEAILVFLGTYMEKSLDSVDLVISACRQIMNCETMGYHGFSSCLSTCEATVCRVLGQNVNALTELSQSGFGLESLLDHLVRILVKLYSSLDSATKYYIIRSKTKKHAVSESRFDKVVDLVGMNLSINIYELISYIEKKHKEVHEIQTQAGKKRSELAATRTRVMKESRAIPSLIFKIEQFENDLIKLGSRCKVDLLRSTKTSTARDFRFVAEKMANEEAEVDEESGSDDEEDSRDGSTNDTDSNVGDNPNAESTRIGSSQSSISAAMSQVLRRTLQSQEVPENSQVSVVRGGNLDKASGPPSKKLKVKFPFRKM